MKNRVNLTALGWCFLELIYATKYKIAWYKVYMVSERYSYFPFELSLFFWPPWEVFSSCFKFDRFWQTSSTLAEFTSLLNLSAMTQKHVLVTVTLACFHTLKHWSRKDHLLRGVPLGVLPVRSEIVTTNASLKGWGAVWRHHKLRGMWHCTSIFTRWRQYASAATFSTSVKGQTCPNKNRQYHSGVLYQDLRAC